MHRNSLMMSSFIHRPLLSYLAAALLFFAACIPVRAQTAAAGETAASAPSAAPISIAQKLSLSGVNNAGKVTDFLYRGAQPIKPGFAELKKLGVTTVINLQNGQREPESERKEVESLGLRYVNIPVSGWSPPSNAQVAEFLSFFKNSGDQKIFIHCRFGEDRTGVMIATYRIAIQHWTADQAMQEMRSFGFHYHWHPNMKDYVRKFPGALATDSAFSAIRSYSQQN